MDIIREKADMIDVLKLMMEGTRDDYTVGITPGAIRRIIHLLGDHSDPNSKREPTDVWKSASGGRMNNFKEVWDVLCEVVVEVCYEWKMWYSLAFILMCVVVIAWFLGYLVVTQFGPIGGWVSGGFLVALGLFFYCVNSK